MRVVPTARGSLATEALPSSFLSPEDLATFQQEREKTDEADLPLFFLGISLSKLMDTFRISFLVKQKTVRQSGKHQIWVGHKLHMRRSDCPGTDWQVWCTKNC